MTYMLPLTPAAPVADIANQPIIIIIIIQPKYDFKIFSIVYH